MGSFVETKSNPPLGAFSFYDRVGEAPQKETEERTNKRGYPTPGFQTPTAANVMTQDYFTDKRRWEKILDEGAYDYIVIGSGFTALAFIGEALKADPRKRILYFWLPSHFQNLPLPFKTVLGGPSETFPFTLSRETFKDPELGYCHGSCPFFGGRSTFWSAWCPQPRVEDMRDFPKTMIKATEEPIFWPEAKKLLHVTSADQIGDPTYTGLQKEIDSRLKLPLPHIPTAEVSEPAQLAVGQGSPTSTLRFNKFSTPGPLLGIHEKQRAAHTKDKSRAAPLDIFLNCIVKKLGSTDDDGNIRKIQTSRGTITWTGDSTQVILCTGAFPAATILQNSFEEHKATVGNRVSGHFLTHIVARVPIRNFDHWSPVVSKSGERRLEIAAHYLAGKHSGNKQQYHVQITAIHSPHPEEDAEDAARECPDYAAAATYDQLKDSTDHVVFVCASLGEFSEHNKNNWFKHDPSNDDPTTNSKLQYTLSQDDKELWKLMDEATYQTIEQMCTHPSSSSPSPELEYWRINDDGVTGYWSKDHPENKEIRIPGIVHETSTAFMDTKEEGGSVDENYRPHGVNNVYITGGAIFPTSGSWNPTLTMCGFAQDLARKLTRAI